MRRIPKNGTIRRILKMFYFSGGSPNISMRRIPKNVSIGRIPKKGSGWKIPKTLLLEGSLKRLYWDQTSWA